MTATPTYPNLKAMNKANLDQALRVLDLATQPHMKLERADYYNVHLALECLKQFVEANTPKPEEEKKA